MLPRSCSEGNGKTRRSSVRGQTAWGCSKNVKVYRFKLSRAAPRLQYTSNESWLRLSTSSYSASAPSLSPALNRSLAFATCVVVQPRGGSAAKRACQHKAAVPCTSTANPCTPLQHHQLGVDQPSPLGAPTQTPGSLCCLKRERRAQGEREQV